jgi:DNA-binding CsgD family transcriptional regulator
MPKIIANCKGTPLSEQELRAVKGLLSGKTYKEMGAELKCAATTVATHIMWARRKWGVTKATRGALLLEYLRRRELILDKALALLDIEFPGRSVDEKTWDKWRMKCASVLHENLRAQRLL